MNGHLKEQAVQLIEDPKATQHQKLTVLLAMMLDIGDKVETSISANPLVLLPPKWRKRFLVFLGGWAGWITLNTAGVPVSLSDIWERLSELL